MIQTFPITNSDEVNAFIETVVEPSLTITDSQIAVTYKCTKDEYKDFFVDMLIDSLERNLFNEEVKLVSIQGEIDGLPKDATLTEQNKLKDSKKDTNKTINSFKSKIKALNALKATWQTSKS